MQYRCFYIMLMALALTLASACTNRPGNVLNEGKMAQALVEIHKTDGILALLRSEGKLTGDSIEEQYYLAALEKMQLTQADFDTSLVWYTKNPKRFEAVYIEVEKRLEKWKKDVEQGKFGVDSILNICSTIFTADERISIADTAEYAKARFEIKNDSLLPHDIYRLHFLQKMDSSGCVPPQVCFKVNYADGSTDSLLVSLFADGRWRRFKLRLEARRLQPVDSISLNLLLPAADTAAVADTLVPLPHAIFDSIFITRTHNIMAQDSLQQRVAIIRKQQAAYHPSSSPAAIKRETQKTLLKTLPLKK